MVCYLLKRKKVSTDYGCFLFKRLPEACIPSGLHLCSRNKSFFFFNSSPRVQLDFSTGILRQSVLIFIQKKQCYRQPGIFTRFDLSEACPAAISLTPAFNFYFLLSNFQSLYTERFPMGKPLLFHKRIGKMNPFFTTNHNRLCVLK